MTKNKRTGIVPLKKKFPPGGVGSRNIALHNKIAIHALTPSFAQFNPYNPNIVWREENVLFDLDSFLNPAFNISKRHALILQSAAKRWNNHIKFSDEAIALIRKDIPSWKGIFMDEYNEISVVNYDPYVYGSVVSRPLHSNSELFHKFSLTLNLNYIPLSEGTLLDIFTRLLGVAMGFNSESPSRLRATYLESGGFRYRKVLPDNDDDHGDYNKDGGFARGFTRTFMGEPSFPNLISAYEKYNGTWQGFPPQKPVKGDDADGIPMGRMNFPIPFKFSNTNEYSTKRVDDYFTKYIKMGVINEVMSVDVHQYKVYISDLSLGFFSDLYSVVDGKKVYTYKKKGTNEIKNFITFISLDGIYFNTVNGQLLQNDYE
jgi:hypothetical protein